MPRAVDGATQRAVDTLQGRINTDPDIQAILARERDRLKQTHDRGGDARDYQQRMRDQITAIAKRKGYVPREGQYFVNPNDGQLEPHGGWAGLSNKTRAAIIAAAAATGVGAAYAAGAFGAGAAGAAGAGGAGAGAGGAGAAGGGLLASSSLPAAITMGAVPSTGLAAGGNAAAILAGLGGVGAGGAGVAGGGAAGGGPLGFLSNNWRDIAGLAGQGLGAASQAQAQNRGTQFAGQLDLERLLLDRDRDLLDRQLLREQEGRAGGTDAWRKLLASQRTLSPGAAPQVSPYQVAPRQATDVERQGAEALSATSLGRLQGGNPIAPVTQRPLSVDPNLLRAGGLEQTAGWLAPVLGAVDLYGRWRAPGGPVSTSRTPTRVEYFGG